MSSVEPLENSTVEVLEVESSAEGLGKLSAELSLAGAITSVANYKHGDGHTTQATSNWRYYYKNRWDYLLTFVVATVLLGIYFVPTIFFILPPSYIDSFDLLDIVSTAEADNKTCSPGQLLSTESVCYNELSSLHMDCSVSPSEELLISISNDTNIETYWKLFFEIGFELLENSLCRHLFRYLHCLLGYGVCNGNRILQLSRESCEAIRDDLCVNDWSIYSQFSGDTFLNCSNLIPASDQCEVDYVWNFSNICQDSKCTSKNTPPRDAPLTCSDSFQYNNDTGTCLPECTWIPPTAQRFTALAKAFAALTILFPLLYFVLALLLQKQWLKFPSVYYIFMNLDMSLFGIITLVQLNLSLFCDTAENLYENLIINSPSLCYFTGPLQVYCIIQLSYWLLWYAAVIYWSLKFPFSYEQAKNRGKIKYIFALSVFISILFPFLALILVVDGFYLNNIVYSACSARNVRHFYVASTLHLSVTMYICTLLLFLDIQALFKEYFKLKKIMKNKSLKLYKLAEFKLLAVAIGFVAVAVCSLIVNVYLTATTPQHYMSMNIHVITCHGRGVEFAKNCDRFEDSTPVLPVYIVSAISLALQAGLPLVIILINSNYSNYTNLIRTIRNKYFSS